VLFVPVSFCFVECLILFVIPGLCSLFSVIGNDLALALALSPLFNGFVLGGQV